MFAFERVAACASSAGGAGVGQQLQGKLIVPFFCLGLLTRSQQAHNAHTRPRAQWVCSRSCSVHPAYRAPCTRPKRCMGPSQASTHTYDDTPAVGCSGGVRNQASRPPACRLCHTPPAATPHPHHVPSPPACTNTTVKLAKLASSSTSPTTHTPVPVLFALALFVVMGSAPAVACMWIVARSDVRKSGVRWEGMYKKQ